MIENIVFVRKYRCLDPFYLFWNIYDELMGHATKWQKHRWHYMGVQSQINRNPTVCIKACSGYQQRNRQCSTVQTLCEENPLVTGRFPSQRTSNIESVLLSWGNHDILKLFSTAFIWWKLLNSNSLNANDSDNNNMIIMMVMIMMTMIMMKMMMIIMIMIMLI